MYKKRFIACALSAILALSPLSTLAVHAEDGQEPPLILYASFDDETANDASGKDHHGTITSDSQFGKVDFVEGVNGGKAIYIVNDKDHRKTNPAANYVDFGENLKVGTDDFSVSLWYKTDAAGVSSGDDANDDHGGNDVSLFGNKDYAAGANVGLTLGNFSANSPADVRVNFSTGTRVQIGDVYICDDEWHHLAASFDRDGSMSVYVDGKFFKSTSISAYKDQTLDVAGQNFVLGADGAHTYGTPGATVDELRMYRSVLTQEQVLALYNQNKPAELSVEEATTLNVSFDDETANDSSASKTNGTIVGDVQFVDGIRGKAVKISNDAEHRKANKAAQYITFGKQDGVTFGTKDFTLAFWHKSEGHGASDSAIIGTKNYASGSNVGLAVGNYHGANSDPDDLRMNISGKSGSRIELKGIPGNDDNWHYIVSSFDRDGDMTVYMDGSKVGSVDMFNQMGLPVDAGEFVLGADGFFTYGADGCLLDEVRIIKKALSAEESTALYRDQILSPLQTLYDQHKDKKETDYTADSWADFKTALDSAADVLNSADPTLAAADAAYAALESAAAKLVKTEPEIPEPADKTELEAAITEAEKLNENDYTADSWSAFVTALNAAKAVFNDESATAEQVENAKAALAEAVTNLEENEETPEPEDPSLILYATFDDETAKDISGRNNNGTITSDSNYGKVEFVEGINGKAIYIVNDSAHRKAKKAANYVDFGENLKVGADDFSVSLWYKTDAAGISPGDTENDDHGGNDVSLFGNKDYNSGGNVGLTLGNFSANTPADVRVNFVANQGTRVEINQVPVCNDEWHHLAASFDRDGSMNVYVDGKLFGSKSISAYNGVSIDVAGQNFVLGADGVHQYGTPGATVDELRMYNTVLTQEKITELYEKDKPFVPEVSVEEATTLNVSFDDETANDSSDSKTNGTIVGDVQFVDGVKGKAVKISNDADHRKDNKAAQYITFGKQDGVTFGSKDFTLAFWHKSEGHGASDSAIIGNKNYASGSNVGLAVGNYHAPNVNSIDDLRMNISGIKGQRVELKQISGNNDNWHYIVSSFDRDGDMTVYMDGRKVGSVNMAAHTGTTVDAGEFVLGADGYFTYGADGCLLDEVRVIKKALSADECTDLYRAQALSLKLKEMREMTDLANTTEYTQGSIDTFKATLERIASQAETADEAAAAALCAELETAYAAFQASANEALLSFDVLTDVHLRDSDSSRAASFIAGLQDISKNHPDSDALVTLGDNVSFGYDNNSRTQYFDLIEQYTGQIPNKVITLGNHDVRKNDSSSSTGFSSNYEVAYKAYMEDNRIYRDDPESDKIYFDKWINGYHFIALNTEDGLKDCIDMTEEQLTWFDQKLGEDENGSANAADPSKPVFVAVHQALNDTHPRANAYGGFTKEEALMTRVREILAKHPQAIVMSGHIHNGFGIATTIDREYGTMIDVPSFNETENGVTEVGSGYQVDVYEDRVHFRAKNYITSTWMPEYDLLLSIPSLPAAVGTAADKQEAHYSPESWNAFAGSLASAQQLLNSTNETARLNVFTAAQNLDTNTKALVSVLDKTKLQTLYNQHKDKKEADYTAETWADFKTALENAAAVLGSSDSTQDAVHAAYVALEAAAAQLKEAADKTELNAALAQAAALDAAMYTEETWNALQAAVTEAQSVAADENAEQTAVDAAAEAVLDAINALEKKPEPADKTELEADIAAANALNEDDYTADSWEPFQTALKAAEAVLNDENATAEQIAEARANLAEAVKNLKKNEETPEPADKTELKADIEKAKALKESDYTADSWKAFQTALKAAETVLNDENATAEQIAEARADLAEAVENLKEKPDEPKPDKVDKTALKDLVKRAEGLKLSEYEKDGQDAFKKALKAAQDVMADQKASQKDVDKAKKDLQSAMNKLKKIMIYTDVNKDAWYYDAIQYNYSLGIMTGLDKTNFGPDQTLARAQFAVILHRVNGAPKMKFENVFPDVVQSESTNWYVDAVLWATKAGVVTGYTDTGMFGPADNINREQMAVMMYRYAKYKGYDVSQKADFSRFEDAGSVNEFAKEAMQWAVGNGIITGKYNETVIDPQGNATRAECATIIQRFMEKYEK